VHELLQKTELKHEEISRGDGQNASKTASWNELSSLNRLNWALGHEGQGVSPALAQNAALHVRIAQPGGQESLNVAAAAAIVLHASGTAI
jgi:tRNA G18 (ribose-2'-O)-methylase SpoU